MDADELTETIKKIYGKKSRKKLKISVAIVIILFLSFSLYMLNLEKFVDRQEAHVLSASSFVPGSISSLRVVLVDHATSKPLANSNVKISIRDSETLQIMTVFEGKTDSSGSTDISFEAPEEEGSYELVVEATSSAGSDVIIKPIKIERDYKILITTDKPLYQPQQTIHMRALVLQTNDLNAAENGDITFEVEDPKGNKVFKKVKTTNEYGIASANFTLADELNLGRYTIRAEIGDSGSETKVKVDRYVLPKFKVQLTTDKAYYLPGETINGELSAQYMFGKSVDGAQVNVRLYTFDVKLTEVANIQGKTDSNGIFDFQTELPTYFVGQPLEKGKGILIFNVSVVDKANHEETVSLSKTVAEDDIIIEVIPESGSLAAGIENIIYIATSYPDGTPVQTNVNVDGENIRTNEFGFASFKITPQRYANLQITATDDYGNSATKTERLSAGYREESVLLRTGKAIYDVGDTVHLSVFSTKDGSVYIDVIKDKQTILTKAVDTENKQADFALDLTENMFGTLEIHAYKILSNGEIERDTKSIIVDIAKDIPITVTTNKDTYLPAEQANIHFDTEQQSAIGVNIVDESVFALQEMEPGFERIYFLLEKELMEPKYEILIFLPEIVYNYSEKEIEATQDEVAKAVLASSSVTGFAIQENSYRTKMQSIQKAKTSYLNFLGIINLNLIYILPFLLVIFLVLHRKKKLQNPHILKLSILYFLLLFLLFFLPSTGVNVTWILIGIPLSLAVALIHGKGKRWAIAALVLVFILFGFFVSSLMFFGGTMMSLSTGDIGADRERAQPPSAPYAKPREAEISHVRQFFPETLYFNPSLITDSQGKATVNLKMADSITTWRLTALASTKDGKLGSTTKGIRVFQDFFIDIDLPVSLTQNDEVSIPVAVYNYLQSEQTVRLVIVEDDWFELMDEKEKIINISANDVSVEHFRIKVKEIGTHTITVYAYGPLMSDAIARSISILPDGQEVRLSASDRLDKDVKKTIYIPEEAIDGASKIFVKVYPGIFSQVVEGLDKMLRMPFGCFEQTSSITYPNVLVMDYMKRTNKITPEIQFKAEEYINLGYQRLLTFEVGGAGFSIFGNPPAEKMITAYGLLEFNDMSKVYYVDPAIITRSQNWLLEQQEAGGFWSPDGHYGGAYKARANDISATCYITWALLESGADKNNPKITAALNYIQNNYRDAWDNNYALGVCSLALSTAGMKSDEILERLRETAIVENNTVYWIIDPSIDPHHRPVRAAESRTWLGAQGQQADIETTAMVAMAYMKADFAPQTVNKVLNYIIQKKDSYGTWGSTQATVLSLKALLMSIEKMLEEANADIEVWINNQKASTIKITSQNSDVLQLVDLKAYTKEGNNSVEIKFSGEGALFYQIVTRFYVPWKFKVDRVPVYEKPVSIDVEYDKTSLKTNDIVTVNVEVEYRGDRAANWLIVDLGIPPGFSVKSEDLDKLKSNGLIARYSITGRQITLYIQEMEPDKPLKFSYRIQARYPIKAKTPQSQIYKYYEPDVKDVAEPVEILVT